MTQIAMPQRTIQFGLVPVGEEEAFRNLTNPEVLTAALTIRDTQVPDNPFITHVGAFTWHEREAYDAVSVITKEGALWRSTSTILPAGYLAIESVLTETHLFRPSDISEIAPEHVRPAEPIHLRPLLAYGRAVLDVA